MKSKYWAMILGGLLALCLLACIPLLHSETAARAEILSDGVLTATVDLSQDQEFTIPSPGGGYNTVTVRDGKIAVTAATCPDHYCMDRGFCDSGTQIVCLPNRLVIRFLGQQEIDGISG